LQGNAIAASKWAQREEARADRWRTLAWLLMALVAFLMFCVLEQKGCMPTKPTSHFDAGQAG
jgi:hypothetical protein